MTNIHRNADIYEKIINDSDLATELLLIRLLIITMKEIHLQNHTIVNNINNESNSFTFRFQIKYIFV